MSAYTDNASIPVMMTPELVDQMKDWTPSVQLKVVESGGGYELTARRVECPNGFECPVRQGKG